MTRYVLGIDGGGTRTRAVILDETERVLGRGESGSSNYDDVGEATAQAHIAQAVEAARLAADLPPGPFDAAFLGLGGIVSPTDRRIIRRIAERLNLAPADKIGVDHDIRIALAGGLRGRPGIVIIAGTGSSCYGRNAEGEAWQAGGWGPLIADEGSGYWLGVQAMKAAMRAFDGRGEPTTLLERVQQHLALADIHDIMHRLYAQGITRAEVAAMAPLVIEAARDNDPVAQAILHRGAEELTLCAQTVARKLRLTAPEIALTGGLTNAGETFLHPVFEALRRQIPGCRPKLPELPPVLGAALLALAMLD